MHVGNFQFWGVLPIWIIVELIMLASGANQGKNKAAKEARLAPPFFGCAHDTVGL